MALHSYAVPEDRSTGERACGVYADDADLQALLPQQLGEPVDHRAFTSPRRACDSHGVGPTRVGVNGLEHLGSFQGAPF
jgi:hypothetical protein